MHVGVYACVQECIHEELREQTLTTASCTHACTRYSLLECMHVCTHTLIGGELHDRLAGCGKPLSQRRDALGCMHL